MTIAIRNLENNYPLFTDLKKTRNTMDFYIHRIFDRISNFIQKNNTEFEILREENGGGYKG